MWHKLSFGKCLQFPLKWSHAGLQTVFEGKHEEQDKEGDQCPVASYHPLAVGCIYSSFTAYTLLQGISMVRGDHCTYSSET